MPAERQGRSGAANPAPLVLIVDDQPGIRQLVQAVLRPLGVRTATAADGQAALAHLARETPQLVLLDLSMPVMDGAQVLSALRCSAPNLPVLIMTAGGGERLAALDLGVQGILVKPFDISDLRERVRRLMMLGGD